MKERRGKDRVKKAKKVGGEEGKGEAEERTNHAIET